MWTIVNFITNVTLFMNFIIVNPAYYTSVKKSNAKCVSYSNVAPNRVYWIKRVDCTSALNPQVAKYPKCLSARLP